MGKVQNAAFKFVIKRIDGYSEEQKDVICSAIDKHGPGVVQHFVSSGNDYKLSADEMGEVLKHIDVCAANSTNLLHLSSLPKAPLLYFARVDNEIAKKKAGPVPLEVVLKNNGNFYYTPYEQCLIKTFYKVACNIQECSSVMGRSNEDVVSFLQFAKEKLINPYIKDGCGDDSFHINALHKIQDACEKKVDAIRLLNCRYSPDQINLLTNAMLNGVDEKTLDKMCMPGLTYQDMYEIEYNNIDRSEITIPIPPAEGPDFNLNDLVIDNEGRRGRCMGYNPELNKYHILFVDPENISKDGWYSPEQLFPYVFDESIFTKKEPKPEKCSNIDDLIARATAISEQSKGLANDLGKFRDGFEME